MKLLRRMITSRPNAKLSLAQRIGSLPSMIILSFARKSMKLLLRLCRSKCYCWTVERPNISVEVPRLLEAARCEDLETSSNRISEQRQRSHAVEKTHVNRTMRLYLRAPTQRLGTRVFASVTANKRLCHWLSLRLRVSRLSRLTLGIFWNGCSDSFTNSMGSICWCISQKLKEVYYCWNFNELVLRSSESRKRPDWFSQTSFWSSFCWTPHGDL